MASEAKTYEDFVIAAGEIKRDLDVVYNPTFGALKKAFSLIFETAGFNGADFKRLSDMQFFQGGRPSPTSPPKENQLAVQVANLLRLENSLGKDNFLKFMQQAGVGLDTDGVTGIGEIPQDYIIAKDDEKKLLNAWQGAGIDSSIPKSRSEALTLLLDKAQKLQNEICDIQDGLKVESEEVEDKFNIKKGNFMKAAGLHALKLRKGDGAAGEKVDDVVDGAENLILAMEPLLKSSK